MHDMNRFASSPAYLNGLPQTGQTTVYVTGDNGTFQSPILHRYEILSTGQYSGTTAIILNGKTENKTNRVVIDHQNKRMWASTNSASVGASSNGTLPFTTNGSGEGLFTYAAAANTALLAGYGNDADPLYNWRIPSMKEIMDILDYEAANALPDATAFPSFPFVFLATSQTAPNATTFMLQISTASGQVSAVVKTTSLTTMLVRNI